MATMLKEKREKKKKNKSVVIEELGPPPTITDLVDILKSEDTSINSATDIKTEFIEDSISKEGNKSQSEEINQEFNITNERDTLEIETEVTQTLWNEISHEAISIQNVEINEVAKETTNSQLYPDLNVINLEESEEGNENKAVTEPTAPLIVETQLTVNTEIIKVQDEVTKIKVPSMSIVEAERLFCGSEIAEIKALSEREALAVDRSTLVPSDHPLVDLLTTFRQSLKAVERERTLLAIKYFEEEKFRSSLWQIKKCEYTGSEVCTCGQNVHLKVLYEEATLLREKLPVARMKLEGISRDVQQSYCHHLYAVLLAHCQIEEYIYQVLHTTNSQVRTALSLILEALRSSDSSINVLAEALQRWASALVAGLLRHGHLADLLFVWHHLFKQNRSVTWAARIMCVSVREMIEVARSVALLEILMTSRTPCEPATECTEDNLEVWEEVDRTGAGSSVTSDAMRERDILAILNAIPFREIVARLVLMRHQNIEDVKDYEWGDGSGGHGVMKAICGVRVLIDALNRCVTSLPHYKKMAERITELGVQCLTALADLHENCRLNYVQGLVEKISIELEAAFSIGWLLVQSTTVSMDTLPFSLLTVDTAKAYTEALITSLHKETAVPIEGVDVVVPAGLPCSTKLKTIAQIAVKRNDDTNLAKYILNFLMMEAFSSKCTCVQKCQSITRGVIHQVLYAHQYLYAEAICTFAGYRIGDEIQLSDLDNLSLVEWVPLSPEVHAVLWHVAKTNATLLPSILLALDYTTKSGLPFESQYTIGQFLCQWVKGIPQGIPPEWCWQILRRLKLHSLEWCYHDAPNPLEEPEGLFGEMFVLLTSSWGHCVPLICENGVNVLCHLCRNGRLREVIHCLSYIMRLMAASPESIMYTTQFSELSTCIIESGPSLMQRALRRGGDTGYNMLLGLIIQQLHTKRRLEDNMFELLSAWVYLCSDHPQLVEAALVCCYDCDTLVKTIPNVFQDESLLCKLSNSTANVAATLCVHTLYSTHTMKEVRSGTWLNLLDKLDEQRREGAKIHVDRVLQSISANCNSEDLVIHKTAGAVLVAPLQHPAHLLLWDLFFYLYLQRPRNHMQPIVGPLFFEGIIKSRTMAHLKKKLQDALDYHKSFSPQAESKTPTSTEVKTPVEMSKKNINTDLLPQLTLVDIIGDNCDISDTDVTSDDTNSDDTDDTSTTQTKVVVKNDLILKYHKGAVRACRQYLKWLEDNKITTDLRTAADISNFIGPEEMKTAWILHIKSMTPTLSYDSPELKRKPPSPLKTPLDKLLTRIRKYRVRNHRLHRPLVLRLPLEEVPTDQRALFKLIVELLKNICKISKCWEESCTKVSKLDNDLWDSVQRLRQPRSFSPVHRSCTKGCRPVTFIIRRTEWCIALAEERKIKEIRYLAVKEIQHMARPQPKVAQLMASLQSAARHVKDTETALIIVTNIWKCASDSVKQCPMARDAFTVLFTNIAQHYISPNGIHCTKLVERWFNENQNAMQLSLSCTIISPRQLPHGEVGTVYLAVLKSKLPPNILFSQLSKFEISKWCENADSKEKRDLLDAILVKLNEYGCVPKDHNNILIELLCVQMAYLIGARDLNSVINQCAISSVTAMLPSTVWKHISKTTAEKAALLPPEEISKILRDLGAIWWAARNENKCQNNDINKEYSIHYCLLLQILSRALLETLNGNPHNHAEHIIWCAWTCTSEGWSPWLLNNTTAKPLLKTNDQNDIKKMFIQTLDDFFKMVPGGECRLLQELFIWCGANAAGDLMAELETLCWSEWHWFDCTCVHSAIKLCSSGDTEKAFVRHAIRTLKCESWLHGVSETTIAPHMAALLYLFTKADLYNETIDEIIKLPWHRLPLIALEPELDRFFMENHSELDAYHTLPQFRVLLYASEMLTVNSVSETTSSHEKGLALISHWIRAITVLRQDDIHTSSMAAILEVIDNKYKSLTENNERMLFELNEFLTRAMNVLCVEPIAATVLPVWRKWIVNARPHCIMSCIKALTSITNFNYFADLAEWALKAYFKIPGCDWSYVHESWSNLCWRECELISRGSLLSVYAVCSLPNYDSGELFRLTILTLLSANIDFVKEEPSIALLICLISRLSNAEVHEASEVSNECNEAMKLLRLWAEDSKLKLLKAITLSKQNDKPTSRLRLLSRLALCLHNQSEAKILAYEAMHMTVFRGATTGDTLAWGRTPSQRKLPALAMKLYPESDQLYRYEMDVAGDS